jgi:hypothetical protein
MSIELIPGATKRLIMTLVQGPEPYLLTNPRVNLTGASVSVEKSCYDLAAPAVSIVDAVNGIIQILWTAAATAGYAVEGVHTVKIVVTYASGDTKIYSFDVTVTP